MSHSILNRQKSICYPLFNYWLMLLLWQNIGHSVNRGILDSIVKSVLLVYLVLAYISKPGSVRTNRLLLFFFFLVAQLITFFRTDANNINISIVVSYLFPLIFIFFSYVYGADFCVSTEDINTISRYIRIVINISILYTVIFEPSQYINAIQSSNAYGTELHSFFASMHEYAIYLFYCISSMLKEIDEREKNNYHKGGVLHYFQLILYFFTLILTFSRTAIVGCIAYLLFYAHLNKKSVLSNRIKYMILLGIIIILLVSPLRNYLFSIVWKSGKTYSRDRLYEYALIMFNNGTASQKLFGYGIDSTRSIFDLVEGYASVHNAYLQVLLYYGIAGLAELLFFLASSILKLFRFLKRNRSIGSNALSYCLFTVLILYANTFIIFYSSIDCFFITTMFLILPKYEVNMLIMEETER